MSLQVAILKVLSGHPNGRATVAALNADLAILNSSGRDWGDRMRRLAARAPDLEIFGQGLVLRDAMAWQLTEAGRALLLTIERPPVEVPQKVTGMVELPMVGAMSVDGKSASAPLVRQIEPSQPISARPKFTVVQGSKAA